MQNPGRLYGATALAVLAAFGLGGGPASADFVINDDLIVIGSTCTGFDCVNGEVFGFDTLVLKENNLRIYFNDTSTGSFPTGDWRIQANDTASGGASYLAIVDAGTTGTGANQVFRVDAGAPNNSLRVSSSGRVGIGTGTPVVNLHIATGNTPTARLEQNTSSGFAAQTWDVAGNETNFFIRDVTTGSRLPFRIRPGAPTSSIDIAASGNVGVGTASPASALHVLRSDNANTTLTLQNTNAAIGRTWEMVLRSSDGDFALNDAASTGADFIFRPGTAGGLTMQGTLVTGGPVCGGGCDEVFDDGYLLPSISEHASLMWERGHLPAVGPTSSGQPLNVTNKLGGVLNELEKAHIYIAELNERLARLEDEKGLGERR